MSSPTEIYDLLGGPSIYDLHSSEAFIAYDAGSSILLWDFLENTKTRLHSHSSQILFIKFFGTPNSQYLLSIDSSQKSELIISNWVKMQKLASTQLPPRLPYHSLKSIRSDYDVNKNLLTIIENFDAGGYRINLLSFLEFELNIVYSNLLEQEGEALEIFGYQNDPLQADAIQITI
jgi:hypothetical protein